MQLLDFLAEESFETGSTYDITHLLNDSDNTQVMRQTAKHIWNKLEDYGDDVFVSDESQLRLYFEIMAKTAPFEYDVAQTYEVATVLQKASHKRWNPANKGIYVSDSFDRLKKTKSATEKNIIHTELARMCFLANTLYLDYLDARTTRTGAPNALYYAQAGQNAYDQIGQDEMAGNFTEWTSHVRRHISLDQSVGNVMLLKLEKEK